MTIYDSLIAKAIGGSGGGGGSSDFSTAVVIVSNENERMLTMSVVENDAINCYATTYSDTYTVPLYKGTNLAWLNEEYTVTVEGDATYDSELYSITITGDCTITIS